MGAIPCNTCTAVIKATFSLKENQKKHLLLKRIQSGRKEDEMHKFVILDNRFYCR